jgi:hypothetical protein
MRYIGLIVLVVLLAACGSGSHAQTPASPSFNVHAATVKACRTILAFQNGSASDTFGQDPASTTASLEAEDTPLEADLQTWVNDLQDGVPYQQIQQDADKVGADCGAVGVVLFVASS